MGEHGNSSTDGGVVDYYTEGRARDAGQESFSPSGRCKLLVRYYGTKPGSWNYSRGTVWAADDPDGKPIADVKRNYSSFEFAWIEGHPNGHSYLVCGEDYQGQTVVELDTGRRRDHLPPEAKQGHAFCWIDYSFHAPTCLLVVGGCHWACPYETRFYDFRDPMTGWPEIEADECIDCDAKDPEIDPDGVTIRCFQSDDNDEDDDAVDPKERVVAAIKTFRRDGDKLLFVVEWVSDKEKQKRLDAEESQRQYEEWQKNFIATDPLYLKYTELVADPALSPETSHGLGVTYIGWGMGSDYTGDERRWCRRIVTAPKGSDGWTIDLEWAVLTGPIKVAVYKNSAHREVKFFEHSAAGMSAAFAYAKSTCGTVATTEATP